MACRSRSRHAWALTVLISETLVNGTLAICARAKLSTGLMAYGTTHLMAGGGSGAVTAGSGSRSTRTRFNAGSATTSTARSTSAASLLPFLAVNRIRSPPAMPVTASVK